MNEVRIGMIGHMFMGKAHSNAWIRVNQFFDLGVKAVMRAVCGRNEAALRPFAERWGWQTVETDWRKLVARPDIDAIDIVTPNNMHAEMAIEAARQGKAIFCEKPLGMNLREAKAMLAAARKYRVRTMVWHNYRRIPAIQLIRQIVKEGRLGRIYHARAVYLQDWILDPKFPLVWRLDAKVAGSGSHGDLNAHIIDTVRYATGEEPVEVCAAFETFIKKRPAGAMIGGLSGTSTSKKLGKVTVDDAVVSLAKLSGGGLATFEATRFAAGRKNGWGVEINGSKGSVSFNFERMNELNYYNMGDPPHLKGFRNILVTEGGAHKYAGAWWPAGHIIGYEHTFVHHAAEFLAAMKDGGPMEPDFLDSTRNQAVLEAMSESGKRRRWVRVPKIN